MSGLPWTAVRCMWWVMPRTPPSSSPPPARPGPPWTRWGSGLPWPVDSAASSRSSTRMRPWNGAAPEHDGADERRVVADHARDQGAAAQGEQVDDLLGAVVGHERGDRAERLDLVDRGRAGVDGEQHRRHPRAPLVALDDGVAATPVTTRPPAAMARTASRTASRCSRSTSAPTRVAGSRGSPTVAVDSRAASASVTSPMQRRRDEGAADGGALLARLGRHLAGDLLDEEVELGAARRPRRGRAPPR